MSYLNKLYERLTPGHLELFSREVIVYARPIDGQLNLESEVKFAWPGDDVPEEMIYVGTVGQCLEYLAEVDGDTEALVEILNEVADV